MATSVGSRIFLIASLILCNAQEPPDPGRITFLRSSVKLTQRTLSCSGEALTLTCTSSGNDIRWNSVPSLGLSMSGNQTYYGFVRSEMVGTSFSDLWNYTNGTAFFVSTVLENIVPGGDCNSSITLVPIPNDEGQYPTFFAPNGLFNITCTTGDTTLEIDRTLFWVYRVAATPMPVPESNAACTYYASHKVVIINITRETTTQDDSEELRHYEVSLNGMNTTAVSAQSENPNGLFNLYPVEPEEDNMPMMAQIVAVDVCGQQSDQTVIRCETVSPSPPEIPTCAPSTTKSSAATYMTLYILASIIILAIISMPLIKQLLMC